MPVFQFDVGDKIVEIDAPDAKTATDTFDQTRVSGGRAAVEGALSGASLGFRDELSGVTAASDLPSYVPGIARMIHGGGKLMGEALSTPGEATRRYTETRDADRATQEAAREQHPYIYGGSQAAGSVLPGLMTAGAVGPGASLIGTIGRGAVAGAGTGAVQGAGEAQTIGDIPREAGIGGAIGGALGAAVPAVIGGVRRAITPTAVIPAERQAAADVLRREGVELTPGQLSGSRRMRYFESEQGGSVAPEMVQQQSRDFTRAALRRAGIDADNARPEVIDAAFTRIGGQFDHMAANSTVRVDRPLIHDLMSTAAEYQNLTAPSQRVPAVQNIIGDIANALNANGGTLSGEAYQALRTRVNELARKATNGELQDAFRGIQGALDNAVERNLPQHLQDAWRTARSQYRNMLVIEKAATAAGPAAAEGVLSPQMLRGALVAQSRRSYARGTGDFSDLVRAGNQVLDKLPDSGTASRLKAQGISTAILGGAGALIGGHAGDNTFGGATAGGVAGALLPAAAARVFLSNLGRRWLANQALPGQTGALTSALSAVPRAALIEQYKQRRQQD